MVTAYNLAVAATALALVFLVHRVSTRTLLSVGLGVFLAASIACAVAGSLGFLIAARSVQGVGAALLLAGSLTVLGAKRWTAAGTFGLALGPALGGVLTQAFDWRAIFIAQAPFAAVALVGVIAGEALLGGETSILDNAHLVPMNLIEQNPYQPRKHFDEDEIHALLERDPETRHPCIRDRQKTTPLRDALAKEGHHRSP